MGMLENRRDVPPEEAAAERAKIMEMFAVAAAIGCGGSMHFTKDVLDKIPWEHVQIQVREDERGGMHMEIFLGKGPKLVQN